MEFHDKMRQETVPVVPLWTPGENNKPWHAYLLFVVKKIFKRTEMKFKG